MDYSELLDTNEHANKNFELFDLYKQDISDYSFEDCTFKSCQFEKVSFRSSIFTSCTFKNCTFLLCNINHVTLNGVGFSDSKLIGLNFSECNKFAFSPDFRNCVLDSDIFFNNKLSKCNFRECRIKDIDFIECEMKEAVFTGSEFNAVTFSKCNLEKSDFLKAKNYSVDPFTNKLRNAKFDLPEAQSFLGFLGIKIIF